MRPHLASLVALPYAWAFALASTNLAVSAWATDTFEPGNVVFHARSGGWQLSGVVATVAITGFLYYLRGAKLVRRALALFLGGVWANTFAPFLWPAGVPDFIRSPFDHYMFFNTADVSLWVGAALFMVGAYKYLLVDTRPASSRARRRRRRP